jgi:BirA family biotin operon repressor/biotin-[acetyl-CoA-carboxylase] ligase
MTAFLARREHFDRVGSTNDVVRAWLAAGTLEVCLATADEQTVGRGREGRRWVAPSGAALLLSLGFRPTWLEPDRVWRLAALTSLAMAEAGEMVAGLPAGTIRLKWPNDLVIATDPGEVRKLAGVLGETDGLGTPDPRVVVGIGLNADWAASDFPPDLVATMTSLSEAAGGRHVDLAHLPDAFLARLETGVEDLRAGRFDDVGWERRQVTTGRMIRLEAPYGTEVVRALGVNAWTGALVVDDPTSATGRRNVLVGEIHHVRLAEPIAEVV